MLLRLAKATWWVFETQTKVVLKESTKQQNPKGIPEETMAMPWAATPLLSKGTALLSRVLGSKVVLFLLGWLPSGVYDIKLDQGSEPKDYRKAP